MTRRSDAASNREADTVRIIDVNLLLYAVHAGSAHHERARDFLDDAMNADETVALPWSVVLGFLRLVTSSRVFPNPLTTDQAIAVVDGWLARPNVITLDADPGHWDVLRRLLQEMHATANRIPDTHLAALAIARDAELCSADADFARFPRLRWTDPTSPRTR